MFLWIKSSKDSGELSIDNMDCIYQRQAINHKSVLFYANRSFNQLEDSFQINNNDTILYFKGILVNSSDLLCRYKQLDIPELIRFAFAKGNQKILADFHGQFCGLYYDSKSDHLIAATNISNTMRLYYYQDYETIIVASSIQLITTVMHRYSIAVNLDEVGARMILSYGYTLGDFTTINNIKQLGAGNCLHAVCDSISIRGYHRFNNEELHHDKDHSIRELERLFLQSIQFAYEKDLQKKREHVAFLSGGLDSRIGLWAAYKQGYRNILCLNFSQPGYADEVIARKICSDLGLKLHFFSLHKGQYLNYLEENLIYNDGQIILHGAAHLFRAINELDLSNYGILHSGQIGDFILGSYLDGTSQKAVEVGSGAYSVRIIHSISNEAKKIGELYPNHEMFSLYNRCFNAAVNGDYACSVVSNSVSPFVDPSFAQYGFNISAKLRYNNKLYKDWYRTFYPEAARYQWEKSGTNLYTPAIISLFRLLSIRGSGKVYRMITNKPPSRSMNPFDLWWNQNSELQTKFGNQSELISIIEDKISPELRKDILNILRNGNFSEILQVYTLLQGIKYLIIGNYKPVK